MLQRTTCLAGLAGTMLLGALGACGDETTSATASGTGAATVASGGSGGAGGIGTSVGGNGGTISTNSNPDCSAPTGSPGTLDTVQVASGYTEPILVTSSWGDGTRLYVVEKSGIINVVKGSTSTVFLDIESRVTSGTGGDERGLLGLAFHPDYSENGRFFVHYSSSGAGPGANSGDTVIEEYRRDPSNADLADTAPVQLIYTTGQPRGNHNGGSIHFSPTDGMLWIGLGDGGGSDDQFANGQDKDTPLATLLRLDVDGTAPYEAPSGNISDGLNLIYDWGLRNPYRWSFDICTGDRYIGDVGQDCFEEISIAAADAGNVNWGWNVMEADHCFADLICVQTPPADCSAVGLGAAAVEIPHSQGNSITGGHVYRGSDIPWLRGAYIYGDFAQGNLWWIRWENGAVTEGPNDITDQLTGVDNPSGFGIDNDGELYVVDYFSGVVYRIVSG